MKRNVGKTISEAEFRRLWADTSVTVAQIGAMLGIQQTAVTSRAKTRNLPRRKARGTPLACDATTLAGMWNAGVKIRDIAAALGCHERTVRNTRLRLGLADRTPGRWASSIPITEYRDLQLRNALEARAKEEQAAMANAEMVDNFQVGRWAQRLAAA